MKVDYLIVDIKSNSTETTFIVANHGLKKQYSANSKLHKRQ